MSDFNSLTDGPLADKVGTAAWDAVMAVAGPSQSIQPVVAFDTATGEESTLYYRKYEDGKIQVVEPGDDGLVDAMVQQVRFDHSKIDAVVVDPLSEMLAWQGGEDPMPARCEPTDVATDQWHALAKPGVLTTLFRWVPNDEYGNEAFWTDHSAVMLSPEEMWESGWRSIPPGPVQQVKRTGDEEGRWGEAARLGMLARRSNVPRETGGKVDDPYERGSWLRGWDREECRLQEEAANRVSDLPLRDARGLFRTDEEAIRHGLQEMKRAAQVQHQVGPGIAPGPVVQVTKTLERLEALADRFEALARPTMTVRLAGDRVWPKGTRDYTRDMVGGEMLNLCGSDAYQWATAFCQIADKLGHTGIDLGWMVGWFANAMCRAMDEDRWKREKAVTASIAEVIKSFHGLPIPGNEGLDLRGTAYDRLRQAISALEKDARA